MHTRLKGAQLKICPGMVSREVVGREDIRSSP